MTEKELTVESSMSHLKTVVDFINDQLAELHCPKGIKIRIGVAADEIFGNIVRCAYAPEIGPVTIRTKIEEDPLRISIAFIDRGYPFDPLSVSDPDITLPANQRRVGGLGLFIVRKTMDDVSYERQNGQNILTIRKKLVP